MSTPTEQSVPFKEKPFERALNLAFYGCLGCWIVASICVSARVTWIYPVLLFQAGCWFFILAVVANFTLRKQNGVNDSFGAMVVSSAGILLVIDLIVWVVNLLMIVTIVGEHPTAIQIAVFASLSMPLAFALLAIVVSIPMEDHSKGGPHQPKLYGWAKAAGY